MRRTRVNAGMFRSVAVTNAPLPPLRPYVRCTCGSCRQCKDNEKWDKVFEKFEAKDYYQERRIFRSALSDL